MRATRRWAAVAGTATAACALAGGVIAAEVVDLGDRDAFTSAVREDPVVQVADIGATDGKPQRGVFAQLASSGHFCLWDAPSASSLRRQGGCNPLADPLGGRELSISFAYDGGPAPAEVTDARLIGLALPEVAEVHVLMSDGSRRPVRLREASVGGAEYRAFGYRLRKADLRRGIAPTAVAALDEAGVELDRQTTGFAG